MGVHIFESVRLEQVGRWHGCLALADECKQRAWTSSELHAHMRMITVALCASIVAVSIGLPVNGGRARRGTLRESSVIALNMAKNLIWFRHICSIFPAVTSDALSVSLESMHLILRAAEN
jgi:hypothetical protein